MESLVLRWGYAAVGVGTFLEGEAILIAGGALAHRGLLSLPIVIAAAFLGSVAGDQFWFQLGRRYGRPFIERRPRWKARSARIEKQLARYGVLFVLGFRFIYGIRIVAPAFLGTTSYSRRRFAVLNVAGAAVWSVAFGCAGWALGASLETLLSRTSRVEEVIGGALALGLVLWLARRRFQHRGGGHRDEEPSP